MTQHALAALMRPRSIAVLGASPRPNTLGNNAVANLQRFGFAGGIYPVHPSAPEVAGLQAYANLASLPEVPDCAVVALSSDKVLATLEEAAGRGLRAAVVFASGFAETDDAGRALQAELQALCERTGLAVCGPNCLGLVNVTGKTSLYSSSVPESLRAGGLAVVSHSGSGCIALSTLGRFGMSYMVSAGNAAVVDMAEYLEYLATDEATKVAALFMEQMRDPARFVKAMAAMHAAGKPVIALKVGRSSKGAAASAAHTGSLAGSGEAYADFFRRNGVIGVDDLDEMAESIALMLAVRKLPRGDGLGMISVSGGETAMLCDVADRTGVKLPDPAEATKARLKVALPGFGTASNPLDATGNAVYDVSVYEACMDALASDPGISLVAVAQDCSPGLSKLGSGNYRRIAEKVAVVAARLDKPVAFFNPTAGGTHPFVVEPFEGTDVAVMQGTRASLLAIRRLFEYAASMRAQKPAAPAQAKADPVWRARLQAGTPFTEREGKQFLAAHGIPVTRESLATTEAEAVMRRRESFRRAGWPSDSGSIANQRQWSYRGAVSKSWRGEASARRSPGSMAGEGPARKVRKGLAMRFDSGVLCRALRVTFTFLVASMAAGPAARAAERPTGTNYVPNPAAEGRLAIPAATATELIQCLVGPDVSVSNVTLTAAPQAAGTFFGKLSVIGFDQGMILSSGDVGTLTGPNLGDSTSTDNTAAGDPDLAALIPGYTTFDAAILEFDFTCSTTQQVVFQYVFGSEEYNEYVNTPFNDVFGFFLNGTNIAVAPAGCSGAGAPVSINNVNCGNPYVAAGPSCDCFRNNDLQDGGGAIDTELDGLVQVFHATGAIQSGTNHIKIAISDAGDPVLDSDVMIRCQSFTCGAPPVTGACCLPNGPCVTLAAADCVANAGVYHGDGAPCDPTPCGATTGACCFGDTSCEVESADSCATNGGSFTTDGTPCFPNPCGAPTGACCFGTDVCEITDPFTCIGTYMGSSTSCDPQTCANLTGACCADVAVCEVGTLAQCGGDTFLGVGTSCDPNPCEQIIGACCSDSGACQVALQANCTGGDTYLGDRTVCDPNPCSTASTKIFADGFESGDWKKWSFPPV